MFKEIVEAGHWAITKAHHEHFVLRWAKKLIDTYGTSKKTEKSNEIDDFQTVHELR